MRLKLVILISLIVLLKTLFYFTYLWLVDVLLGSISMDYLLEELTCS